MSDVEFETCPRCGSRMTLTDEGYPKAYECLKCGHTIVKSPQALVDD